MSLRKESDKELKIEKKSSSFRKENNEKIHDKENFNNHTDDAKQESRQTPKGNVTKGFDKYKSELENDDYGVESTGKMSEKAFRTGSSTTNKVKEFKRNRSESKLKKADEEHYKSVVKKLGNEQKNKQHKPSTKLKKDQKNTFDASKDNKSGFLKKVMNQPKQLGSSAKGKGMDSYKEALESDDDGVKTGTEGFKLVKGGAKSVTQANRVRKKKGADKKLKGHNTKLKADSKLGKASFNSNLKKGQKALQKKKIMRSNIYKSREKTPLSAQSIQKTGMKIKSGAKAVKKAVLMVLRKVIGTKVMVAVGAILLKLLPVFVVLGIVFGVIMIVMSMGGGGGGEEEIEQEQEQEFQGLDPEVEQWRELVTEVAEEKNMSDYIDLVLAIIQIETGGDRYKDIMQSSESAGYEKNHFQDERESVEQGISHLKNVVETLESYNDDYVDDTKLIAQTYNFGLGFAGHVGSGKYDGYDIEISESYSKDIVAVSLGNLTGEKYTYKNAVSERLNKPYLYKNGGNFLYGELVSGYVGGGSIEEGELFPPVEPMVVTSLFGNRASPGGGIGSTNHKGLDLACVGGSTPIKSIQNGTVVKSQNVNGLGNAVVVKHEDSLYSTYGHMSSLSVKSGQTVKAGDQLGVCGSTGNSTGPHLHLEISPQPHLDQVDPYPYVKHLIGG